MKRSFFAECKRFLKRMFRNFSLWLRYAFDWIFLALKIRCFRPVYKGAPVFLCIADPGSVGGTELQIEIIADVLKRHFGNCFVLISGKLERGRSNLFVKRLQTLRIPILRLRSLGLVPYEQWPFLKKQTTYLLSKVLKNGKICHFFNPRSTVLAPLMENIGLAVYYMETGMPTLENSGWKILHRTICHFSHVTSVSFAGLSRLKLLYGYKGPFSVTPSMFYLPQRKFLCRKPIEGVFELVYFGRMTKNKGIDLLLESFCHLLKRYPYARLSLIGSGERVSLFQTRTKELQISDRVKFIDWLQNDALFSRLVTMDLFCLPSFSEGMPCSILEAMSIGLPVVATDVGGISEIIEHNVSGMLIPPRDGEALTKVLLDLAGDPSRRMQLREEALLRWEKVGAKEVVISQLMAAYCLHSG